MNEQISPANRERIARLAREIWLSEGGKTGRDLEYWLRAERQVLAAGQPGKAPAKNEGAKKRNPEKTSAGRVGANAREHIWA
jgi:hypothetical protein